MIWEVDATRMAINAAVQSSSVEFPGDGAVIRAFLSRPTSAGPRPAVVIIHEYWGLNDHMRELAERFVREGYVALVPDLYSRFGSPVAKDAQEAGKLMGQLSSQQALKDLNAATKYLNTQPFVDAPLIGAVGFCMGGTFSLMMAANNSDIKASVTFYGQIPPSDTFKYFLCPILFLYGGQDDWVPKADVERLRQGLQELGKPGEVRIYPTAGHAFFNDTRPEVYKPAEARDVWQRVLAFLKAHLSLV